LFGIKDSLDEETSDFEVQRKSLQTRITKWRHLQDAIMPQVGDYVQQQTRSLQGYNQVECETLYLPSDFPSAVQVALGLTSFGECQRRLLARGHQKICGVDFFAKARFA
jgi:hypothetical protein